MAKQLVTLTWCDNAARHNEAQIDATSVRVAIDNKPAEIDLCDECRAELIDPLRELLATHGQPVRGTAATPSTPPSPSTSKTRQCPDCEKTYGTSKGLREHRKNVHQWVDPRPAKHQCPDCPSSFVAAQGLSAHRMQSHGWRKGDDDDQTLLSA